MKVVSNTSPINYLVLIGAADVLHQLFDLIWIPDRVRRELSDANAPALVRSWITDPPDWLHVDEVSAHELPQLTGLHPGERDAILLAEILQADLIILDDQPARAVAAERGLKVTGTLGVLSDAGTRGLIEIPGAVDRLPRTTFRAKPSLFKWLLDQHGGPTSS